MPLAELVLGMSVLLEYGAANLDDWRLTFADSLVFINLSISMSMKNTTLTHSLGTF
jgi:hypothetical protein